jgi:hypothetical protein
MFKEKIVDNLTERERVERGIRLAAIYGIAPAQMKLCGRGHKEAPQILENFLANKGGTDMARAREVLENFEAAYQYYQLIAKANGVADPFDERVVEAYWIGNDLLAKVKPEDIKKMILDKFVGAKLMTREDAESRVAKLPAGIVAHHNFHVLKLGAASEEARKFPRLFDFCSVNAGVVESLGDGKVRIKYRPIIVKDKKIEFAERAVEKQISWDKNIAPEIKKGDVVAFHWNRVCQKLTAEQAQNLREYTERDF